MEDNLHQHRGATNRKMCGKTSYDIIGTTTRAGSISGLFHILQSFRGMAQEWQVANVQFEGELCQSSKHRMFLMPFVWKRVLFLRSRTPSTSRNVSWCALFEPRMRTATRFLGSMWHLREIVTSLRWLCTSCFCVGSPGRNVAFDQKWKPDHVFKLKVKI